MKTVNLKIDKTIVIHVLLVLFFCVFLVNWFLPVLRFSNPKANYFFSIIFLTIPLLLLINGFFFKKYRLKVLNGLVLIFPSLIMLNFILLNLISLVSIKEDNIDPSFDCVNTISLEKSIINVYRTDGGATTSIGIVVRQEMELLFGLKLVKNVFNEYPKYDVEVKQVDLNKIVVDGKPFLLNNYVYF